MSYCTVEDLTTRFGEQRLAQRTDRVNKPATTVDVSVVDKHILDASSLIDGYLAKKVALPLQTVPPVLTKLAVDLSWYFIMGDSVQKDSAEAVAYREAIRWLQDVAKGLIVLEAGGIPAPQSGAGEIQIKAPRRVFTRDTLGSY